MNWTVPPMWKGRTVAILASGPSMSKEVADRVRHLPRIAVNNTWELAPDAEIIYAADSEWWDANPAALQTDGVKLTIEPLPGVATKACWRVEYLRNTGREGFDPDPSCLRTHNNSGAQAVQVAAHAGATQILLLGFDMRGGHWHEATDTDPKQMARWVTNFRGLAQAMRARGVDLVNCTEGSALDCVRFVPLDRATAQREAA